jgi:hypothetical protein
LITDECFANDLLTGLGSRCTHGLETRLVHEAAPTRDPYHQRQWELGGAFSAFYDRLPFVSRLFHLQLLERAIQAKERTLLADTTKEYR